MKNIKNFIIPLDVPKTARKDYVENYSLATKQSGNLMLFAGDQKVEHLNDDFYGANITPENNNPEHMFEIANNAKIGVFATQLGLISRYGMDYKHIPYLVKLNSKSHLVKVSQADPVSKHWLGLEEVLKVKKNGGLSIVGVGYTIYFGSEYESEMLHEAASIINEAHEHGLLAVIWAYPRGKAVTDEKDAHLIAGAAGATACLGADFVKVNYPKGKDMSDAEAFKETVVAAGRTKVICAGGSSTDVPKFLQRLHDQIHISGAAGNATGRNIHQKSLKDAVRFCDAIYGITVDNLSVEKALAIYNKK